MGFDQAYVERRCRTGQLSFDPISPSPAEPANSDGGLAGVVACRCSPRPLACLRQRSLGICNVQSRMQQTFLLQLGWRPATGFATMLGNYDMSPSRRAGW
jgi:hypothetical protein